MKLRAFLHSLCSALCVAVSVLPAVLAFDNVNLGDTMSHAEQLVDFRFRHLATPQQSSLSALMSFHLNWDGTYSHWEVRRTSGDSRFDAACRTAVDSVGFARFEGKPYLFINATFRGDGKGGTVSFSSPDVRGASSKVDRVIAQTKAIHINSIKIVKDRIAKAEKIVGPNDGRLSENINFLANEYKEVGDYANAEATFKRALAIREKANGAQSPEVAQSLTMLGEMYLAKGDKVAAEKTFKSVLDMSDLKSQAKVKTLQAYAKMQMKEGKQAEADAMFKQISDIMQNKTPEKTLDKTLEKTPDKTADKTPGAEGAQK